jgi:hypothetical protein
MSMLWVQAAGHGDAPSFQDPDTGLHFPVPGLHPRRHTTLVPLHVLGAYGDPYDHRGIEHQVERARRTLGENSEDPEAAFLAWQRQSAHVGNAPVRLTRHSTGRVRISGGREFVNAAHDMEFNPARLDGFHALPTEVTDLRHPGHAPGPDRLPPLYHGTSTAGLTQIRPAVEHSGLEYARYHSPEADHHFAYATANLEEATHYARGHAAVHDTQPLVYRVRPRGPIEPDPPHHPADRLKLNERSADVRAANGFDVEHVLHPGWD